MNHTCACVFTYLPVVETCLINGINLISSFTLKDMTFICVSYIWINNINSPSSPPNALGATAKANSNGVRTSRNNIYKLKYAWILF